MLCTENNICELAVIIVNYKTPQLVLDCVGKLLPEINSLSAKIVLVDNCSNDDSIKLIEKWIAEKSNTSQIIFIKNENNIGFSGGNNTGINAIKANYYLLLNSDAFVTQGAVSALLDMAKKNQKVGLVGPQLVNENGKKQTSCFHFHSPIGEFVQSANTGLITSLFSKYNVAILHRVEEPEWISFACVLIRNDVFRQVGLLDDRFFMYFEDAEFCFRAKKSGWKCVFCSDAIVVHLHGISSKLAEKIDTKKRLPRYYYESRARYYYLIYGFHGLFFANILWELGRLISIIRQFFGRKDKAVVERKWKDIWINSLKPLKAYTHPDQKKPNLTDEYPK